MDADDVSASGVAARVRPSPREPVEGVTPPRPVAPWDPRTEGLACPVKAVKAVREAFPSPSEGAGACDGVTEGPVPPVGAGRGRPADGAAACAPGRAEGPIGPPRAPRPRASSGGTCVARITVGHADAGRPLGAGVPRARVAPLRDDIAGVGAGRGPVAGPPASPARRVGFGRALAMAYGLNLLGRPAAVAFPPGVAPGPARGGRRKGVAAHVPPYARDGGRLDSAKCADGPLAHSAESVSSPSADGIFHAAASIRAEDFKRV